MKLMHTQSLSLTNSSFPCSISRVQLVKQVEMKLLTHKPLNHTEIYIWDTVSAAIGLIMNTSLVNQFNTTNNATGEIRPALCAKILVGQPIGFCVYQDILEQEPFSGLRYFYFSCAEGSGGGVAVRKPNSDEWYSISISFSDDDMLVGTRTAIGGVQELEIYVDLMNMNCIPSVAATLCTQFVRFHHPLPCVLYLIN